MRSAVEDDSDADSLFPNQRTTGEMKDDESAITASSDPDDDKSTRADDDWIPGQDVQVDHAKILDILVSFLSEPSGEKLPEVHGIWSNSPQRTMEKTRRRYSSRRCGGLTASSKSAPRTSCPLCPAC
jgi:hypothetical protein